MIKRLISPINRLIELFNAAKIQKIVNRVPHIFLHLNSVCLSRIGNEKARNPRRVPRLFLQPDAGIDGGDVPRVVAVWEQTVFLRFYQKQLDIGHPC